jgi:hypothetical protein
MAPAAKRPKTPGEPGVSAEVGPTRDRGGALLPVRRLGAAGVCGDEGTHRGPHAVG